MKKTITLRAATLAACIALTCTACGGGSQSAATTNAGSETKQAAQQEKPAQQEKQTQQEKPAAENPPTPENPNGCALAEQVNNEIPKTAPKVDQWVDIKGIGVPTSAIYGPEKREGDLFTCYQHSPTGALFATFYATAGVGRVPGADKAWLSPTVLARVNKASKSDKHQENKTDSSVRIIGYRFESYTPEKSVISLAFSVQNRNGEQAVSMRLPLIWSKDRWLLTEDGFGTPLPLNNLQSFTAWNANT
ncbi:hypothetical protein ACUH97_01885 [Dermabacteraceae bacterium P13088]